MNREGEIGAYRGILGRKGFFGPKMASGEFSNKEEKFLGTTYPPLMVFSFLGGMPPFV